ncbi:hypothetical protein KCU99_g420, partial [Aureobasidium melanogenum]
LRSMRWHKIVSQISRSAGEACSDDLATCCVLLHTLRRQIVLANVRIDDNGHHEDPSKDTRLSPSRASCLVTALRSILSGNRLESLPQSSHDDKLMSLCKVHMISRQGFSVISEIVPITVSLNGQPCNNAWMKGNSILCSPCTPMSRYRLQHDGSKGQVVHVQQGQSRSLCRAIASIISMRDSRMRLDELLRKHIRWLHPAQQESASWKGELESKQLSEDSGVDQRIRTCQGHYDCLALPKIRLEVIQIHKHVRTRNAFVERVLTNQDDSNVPYVELMFSPRDKMIGSFRNYISLPCDSKTGACPRLHWRISQSSFSIKSSHTARPLRWDTCQGHQNPYTSLWKKKAGEHLPRLILKVLAPRYIGGMLRVH